MLGFSRGPASHFAKDEAKLAELLSDAKRFKGESLWQDAWRRLKLNRGAFISLIFLIFFMGLSLIAPLLPVPSPMALDLVNEPQPPNWPWSDNPRLAENLDPARKAKRFGLYSTEAKGAFADNGWQHRSFIDLVRPMAPGETEESLQPDPDLAAFVQDVSGRESIAYLKPGELPDTVLERHAVVYRASDRNQTRYTKGEHEIPVRVSQMLTPTGTTAVFAEWLLPGEAPSAGGTEELGYTNEGVVGSMIGGRCAPGGGGKPVTTWWTLPEGIFACLNILLTPPPLPALVQPVGPHPHRRGREVSKMECNFAPQVYGYRPKIPSVGGAFGGTVAKQQAVQLQRIDIPFKPNQGLFHE